jgi:hypothetical protein
MFSTSFFSVIRIILMGNGLRVKGILEKLKVKILFEEKLKRIRMIKKLRGH